MEVINVDSIHREAGYIKVDRDFKDIMMSALRYAMPRHTYIVDETCEYIKENADLILDERVIMVMLRDLNEQLDYYRRNEGSNPTTMWRCDYDTLDDLRRFLEDYDITKVRKNID